MLLNAKLEAKRAAEAAGTENRLTDQIIGAAIEVHRHLGPGLLESAYEECLCYELNLRQLSFKRQISIPLSYKGLKLDCAYRLDFIVEDAIVVELKAAADLDPIHASQLLTYLKILNKRVGLLINFNVPVLKNGLKRVVNRYAGPAPGPSPSATSAESNSSKSPASHKQSERSDGPKTSAFSSASPRLRVERTPSTATEPPCSNAF